MIKAPQEESMVTIWQRYRSQRKNLFDLRRHAALNNLSLLEQL